MVRIPRTSQLPAVFCLVGMMGISVATAACGGGDDDASSRATVAPGKDGGKSETALLDATVDAPPDAGEVSAAVASNTSNVEAQEMALVRFANWSVDAPPVDFCLAPHGTTAFRGPFLAQLNAALAGTGVADAGAASLAFPGVSSYVVMPPAAYDARVVVGGATDCSMGILDSTSLPAVPTGGAETIALMGRAHPSTLTVRGFLDDDLALAPVELRLVNASPDVSPVDLALNGAPVLVDAPFGGVGVAEPPNEVMADAAAPPAVDGHGYATLTALSQATLTARATTAARGSPAAATATQVSIAVGAIVTVVVVGRATTGGDAGTPGVRLVECVDNGATAALQGSCSVVSM
jgi:hypothetical protein